MPWSTIAKNEAQARARGRVKRWSIAGTATVHIGAFSRGGRTRGNHHATDHDRGWKEKDIPWGMVDEDDAHLHIPFGSSYTTSDCIVDVRAAPWDA
jgi:hypothetical protein